MEVSKYCVAVIRDTTEVQGRSRKIPGLKFRKASKKFYIVRELPCNSVGDRAVSQPCQNQRKRPETKKKTTIQDLSSNFCDLQPSLEWPHLHSQDRSTTFRHQSLTLANMSTSTCHAFHPSLLPWRTSLILQTSKMYTRCTQDAHKHCPNAYTNNLISLKAVFPLHHPI